MDAPSRHVLRRSAGETDTIANGVTSATAIATAALFTRHAARRSAAGAIVSGVNFHASVLLVTLRTA